MGTVLLPSKLDDKKNRPHSFFYSYTKPDDKKNRPHSTFYSYTKSDDKRTFPIVKGTVTITVPFKICVYDKRSVPMAGLTGNNDASVVGVHCRNTTHIKNYNICKAIKF